MVRTVYIYFLILIILTGCAAKAEQVSEAPMPSVLVVEEESASLSGTQKPQALNSIEQTNTEYIINLSVNPETSVIKGNQRVSYVNKSDDELMELCFNMPLNAFSINSPYQPYFAEFRSKIFSGEPDYGYMDVTGAMSNGIDAMYHVNSTRLYVYLDKPLSPGKKCEVSIQFEAYIPKINHRTGSNKNAMWMGAFLPYIAVYENGAYRFDTYYAAGNPFYSETANYSVNITTPADYRVVGSGSESVKVDGNTKTTSFGAKFVRDFSFALLDGSYNKLSKKTESGIDINFYYRTTLSDVENLINYAQKACAYFESVVGRYPYSKIDIVEAGLFVKDSIGFSQIIFIDSEYMLEQDASRGLIREIGKQWFYNIVGSDRINSAWMDEGIVSLLMEKIYYDDIGDYYAKLESDYNELEKKLSVYSNSKLSDNISEYNSWANYYDIQVTKGKLMLSSLNLKIGDEKFNEFLKNYFSLYSYKIATIENFTKLTQEVYGEDLSRFFNTWLNSKGLPPL